MSKEKRCENCKHSYSYFKQITTEKGLPDFITIPKCRLGRKILPDGTPECDNCFEPRN